MYRRKKKDMIKEKKIGNKMKAGIITLLVFGIICGTYTGIVYSNVEVPLINDEAETEWVKVAEISINAVGEYAITAGKSGWLSTFCLDYAQVPETVLLNNATDWSINANAMGYVDADGQTIDLESEDPFYFVARCRFNDTAKDGGVWNDSRYRVNLTVSGDETISGVGEYNNSGTSGDAVISSKTTNYIYINFWWSDGVDGYRITDDGTLTWSIILYEKR